MVSINRIALGFAAALTAALTAGPTMALPVEIRFDNPAGGAYSPATNPGPVFSRNGVTVTATCGTTGISCSLSQNAEGLGVSSTRSVFGFLVGDGSSDIDGSGADDWLTLTLNSRYRLLRVDFEMVNNGDESALIVDGLQLGFGNIGDASNALGLANATSVCGLAVDDGAQGLECNVSLAALDIYGTSFRFGQGLNGSNLDSNDNFRIESIVLEQIPEPVSFALFGSALLGLGLARRRR